MTTKPLRIGIVGGSFGATFQFHLHPDCVVEAVCELDPERLKHLSATYSCANTYATLDEMLKDPKVEAVGLFTPAPLHVKQSIQSLRAGRHVMCAVPAAMSLEELDELVKCVEETGLTYMMAETSYYQQAAISARKFYQDGSFGEIFFTEAEYHHAGLECLFYNEDGSRTWRHGFPPMHYPTHSTAYLVGITGERLVEVVCHGWGDGSKIMADNAYKNPFWNETAMFKTDKGNPFRVAVYWYGAHRGCERAQWYGSEMSFFMGSPNGYGPFIVRNGDLRELDQGGFIRQASPLEPYDQPHWWATDMLPEELRVDSFHDGSHSFLTHEFVDAVIKGRRPSIDVYEAAAYTAPGIVAHQSALKGGELLKVPSFDPGR